MLSLALCQLPQLIVEVVGVMFAFVGKCVLHKSTWTVEANDSYDRFSADLNVLRFYTQVAFLISCFLVSPNLLVLSRQQCSTSTKVLSAVLSTAQYVVPVPSSGKYFFWNIN